MTFNDTLAALQESLTQNGVPKDTVAKVIRDLRKAQQDEKADKVPVKKQRYQFVPIIHDPEGKIAAALPGVTFTATIAQIDAELPASEAVERIRQAAFDHNASRYGQKHPIKTLAEAAAHTKRCFLRERKVAVKTREPVEVVVSSSPLVVIA